MARRLPLVPTPMNTSSLLKRFVVMLTTVAALQSGASAATIAWYSEVDSTLLNSNGQDLDASYSFEIGTFGAFIPTAANLDQWAANWKIMDKAFQDDAHGWNYDNQFYTRTVEHSTTGNSESAYANPSDVFIQGERIYLWAYNSKDLVFGSEWALVTDTVAAGNSAASWVVPDPLDPPGTNYDMNLADAETAVFGGTNNVRGGGTFNATPAVFNLQTASVVPEPGSALLIFAAGVATLLRRTSRRLSRPSLS